MLTTLTQINNNLNFGEFLVQLDFATQNIFWEYNPYRYVNTLSIKNTLITEKSIKNDSKHISLRNRIMSDRFIPKIDTFNLLLPEHSGNVILKSSRDRRYMEAPITTLVVLFAQVMASDKQIRMQLGTRLMHFKRIPSIFIFYFNKIRQSRCGNSIITPKLKDDANISENLLCTAFDKNFILSQEGIDFIVILLDQLQDEDYFVMEDFVGIPKYHSHNMTTLCGIILANFEKEISTMAFLPGNTIRLDSPQLGRLIIDASMLQPRLIDENGKTIPNSTHPSFNVLNDDRLIHFFYIKAGLIKDLSVSTVPSIGKRSMKKRKYVVSMFKENSPKGESLKFNENDDFDSTPKENPHPT